MGERVDGLFAGGRRARVEKGRGKRALGAHALRALRFHFASPVTAVTVGITQPPVPVLGVSTYRTC